MPIRADAGHCGIEGSVAARMPNVLEIRLHHPPGNDLGLIVEFQVRLEIALDDRDAGEGCGILVEGTSSARILCVNDTEAELVVGT